MYKLDSQRFLAISTECECDLFSEQTEADYLRNFSARNILHKMADPRDASEMSMDVSGSTRVEELDPTGLNKNSRQSSSTAEMIPPEIYIKIFGYLSIQDRLHFRFVPFKGLNFILFKGNFIKNQTEIDRFWLLKIFLFLRIPYCTICSTVYSILYRMDLKIFPIPNFSIPDTVAG
jgi:hypothetical protein